MKKIEDISKEEYTKTLNKAYEIIEKLNRELSNVSITTKSPKVVEAVNKVFNLVPNSKGQIVITYEMYNKVIEIMNTSGQYKAQEYT